MFRYVGVARIDSDHERIFNLLRSLEVSPPQTTARLHALLASLRGRLHSHFREEERRLALAGYPFLGKHRALHEAMARQLSALEDGLMRGEGKVDVACAVALALTEQIRSHIYLDDFAASRYLRRSAALSCAGVALPSGVAGAGLPLEALLVGADTVPDVLERELEGCDVVVHTAASQWEASDLVARRKLDLIFLHLGVRTVDAATMVAFVRRTSSNYDVPVVALTDRRETLRRLARVAEVGVTNFLTSPPSPEHVRELMGDLKSPLTERRRRYERAPVDMPVVFCTDGRQQLGAIQNLSSGGMLLVVASPPSVGDCAVARFAPTLRGGRSGAHPGDVIAHGRVLRVGAGNAVAVQFQDFSGSNAPDLISEFIAERLAHPAEGLHRGRGPRGLE